LNDSSKCALLLSIFLASHLAAAVHAQQPSGIDVTFEVINANEECDSFTSTASRLVLQTESWTTLCLRVNGIPEETGVLEIRSSLHSNGELHRMFEQEVFLTKGLSMAEHLAFDTFVPGSWYNETAQIDVMWSILSTTGLQLDEGQFTISVSLVDTPVDAVLTILEENPRVPAGVDLSLPAELLSTSNQTGYYSISTKVINIEEKSSQLYMTLPPYSAHRFSALVPTASLSVGMYELELLAAQNSSAPPTVVSAQFEVIEAQPLINVDQITWNRSVLDKALHPNMNLSVSVAVANSGSLEGGLDLTLECNDGAFVQTKQRRVPSGFSGDLAFDYTLSSSTTFGEFPCSVHALDGEYQLPTLLLTPWPTSFSFVPQGLQLNQFEYHSIEAGSDFSFDFLLSKAGQGTERVQVDITAEQGEHSIPLETFIHTFGPGETRSGTLNQRISTCFSGLWDIVATIDFNDERPIQVLRLESILETQPTAFSATIVDTDFSTPQILPGTNLGVDVLVEVHEPENLGCHHLLPIQIVAKNQATGETATWDQEILVGASNQALEQFTLNTSSLTTGTHEFYVTLLNKLPVLNGIEILETSDAFTIDVSLPTRVVEVACVEPGLVQAMIPNVDIQCAVTNPLAMPAVVKLETWNSEGKMRQRVLTVPPMDEVETVFSSTHTRFGEHAWALDAAVLQSGQYIKQDTSIELEYRLIHPEDRGTSIVDVSIWPDAPMRGAPVTVHVRLQWGSDVLQPYLNVQLEASQTQSMLYAVESLGIGTTTLLSFDAVWPNDCDLHDVQVQLYRDENASMAFGDSKLVSAKSCPVQLPDLEVLSFDETPEGVFSVAVVNKGGASSKATTVHVLLDGVQSTTMNLPGLEPGEHQNLTIPSSHEPRSVTVELDPDDRVRELQDGFQNKRTYIRLATEWNAGITDTVVDSDGDGLSDEVEREGWDVAVISNKDDLENVQAYLSGNAPSMYSTYVKPSSNVLNIDSDGDGITDYAEFLHQTNPLLSDTDGDGLSDLYELESEHEDPVMVESNPPEITSVSQLIDSSTSARAWGDKRLSTIFYVEEDNLESVQIHYNVSGENVKIIEPEFLGFEQGLRKYTVSYTVNKYQNIIREISIHVEAVDVFGETSWADIATYDTLGKRITTKLANFAYDNMGALGQSTTAFGAGVIYSLFTLMKDMVDGLMGVIKFFHLILTDQDEAYKTVIEALEGLSQLFNTSVLKQLPGLLYGQAVSLSPFKDATANNLFVSGFVLGYLVLTAAMLIVGGAGYTYAKSMMKSGKGTDAVSFMDELKKGVKKKVEDIKNLKQLPQKFKSGFAKLASGKSNILVPLLAAGTMSQYKSVSVVFKAMSRLMMKVDKDDVDSVNRLTRAIKIAEHPKMANLHAKWVKLPLFGQGGKTMAAMRKAVNDPDLFKGVDSLGCVDACMDEILDEFIGTYIKNDGTLLTGKGNFKIQRAFLDEIYHLGRIDKLNGERVVTIKPGQCTKVCDKNADIDNMRITYNKDGSVKEIELIDRKVYGSEGDLNHERKMNTIDRGGTTSDYHKDNFKKYFDGPEGKENFKEYLKNSGLSDDEIEKVYDEMKKFANGDSTKVKSRYSVKKMDLAGGPTSVPPYANCWKASSPLNCEDFKDDIKKNFGTCDNKDYCTPKGRPFTEKELDDMADEMLNTEYIELPDAELLTPLQRWSEQSATLLVAASGFGDVQVVGGPLEQDENGTHLQFEDFIWIPMLIGVIGVGVWGYRNIRSNRA
jgi:hypothetical protein